MNKHSSAGCCDRRKNPEHVREVLHSLPIRGYLGEVDHRQRGQLLECIVAARQQCSKEFNLNAASVQLANQMAHSLIEGLHLAPVE
jgi:hypothetical protein